MRKEDRPERIEKFTKRFGEIEVKFIDETDISVEQLLERNKKWHIEKTKLFVIVLTLMLESTFSGVRWEIACNGYGYVQ